MHKACMVCQSLYILIADFNGTCFIYIANIITIYQVTVVCKQAYKTYLKLQLVPWAYSYLAICTLIVSSL